MQFGMLQMKAALSARLRTVLDRKSSRLDLVGGMLRSIFLDQLGSVFVSLSGAGVILLSFGVKGRKLVEGHMRALRDGRQRLLRAPSSNNSSPVLAKAPSVCAAQCITLFVDFQSELPWFGETCEQRGGHLHVRMLRPVPTGRFAVCSGTASARLDGLLWPGPGPSARRVGRDCRSSRLPRHGMSHGAH